MDSRCLSRNTGDEIRPKRLDKTVTVPKCENPRQGRKRKRGNWAQCADRGSYERRNLRPQRVGMGGWHQSASRTNQ